MIGSPNLTQAHQPELDRCIKQTKPGQAGWAGWNAPNKTCAGGLHFEKEKRKSVSHDLKGRCDKFRKLTGKQGPKFSAQCFACRFFIEANVSYAKEKAAQKERPEGINNDAQHIHAGAPACN
jgi:hypothetical protein